MVPIQAISGKGFFFGFGRGTVLTSVRELIASRVTIDMNTIRSSSSRRAKQQKGMHSAEVNLWKMLT